MTRWWARILAYAPGQIGGLAAILLATFAGIGLELAQPWPIKLAIDQVLQNRVRDHASGGWALVLPRTDEPVTRLAYLTGASVVLFVLWRLVGVAESVLKSHVGARLTATCGGSLFQSLLRKSQAFHARRPVGDLVRRVNHDAACLRWLVFGVLLPLVTSTVTLILIVFIVWRIDPYMTLLAMGMVLPLGIVIRLASKPMTRRSYEQATQEGLLSTVAERSLSNVPLVQAFRQETREHRAFADQADTTIRATLRTVGSQLWFKGGVSLVTAVGVALVMGAGGYRAIHRQVTVGDVYLFIAYLGTLYGPVESLAYLASGIATSKARALRVLEVLDEPEPITDPHTPKSLPVSHGGAAIRFCGVRFGYEPGRPVLIDIDLDIQPGQTVAFVGPSGAGKSSLLGLIPRFFDPWDGAVLVNGIDIRHVCVDDLRAQVALVPQEPMLMPLTVAQNIAFGSPSATRAEIERAACLAGADTFIRQLPDGYETMVGERGATLSGGQAQRIAIARAALCDPSVLILDEPTSALDAETETSVMGAIDETARNRTTLIIAHRLSTVRQAHRVVMLRDGRIAEMGTHAELMSHRGHYYRLVMSHDHLVRDKREEPELG